MSQSQNNDADLDRNYKTINFGQGKGHLVFDQDLIRHVQDQVVQKSRIKLYNGNKYYKILEDGDSDTLKSLPHMVTFCLDKRAATLGYLYLFKYRGRPTCMYIREKKQNYNSSQDSREKTWDYILVKHRFNDRLYNGTLFQGEFVQVNKFQHLFLINDLLMFGNRAHLRELPDKIHILQKIFKEQFTPDPCLDTHQLLLKEYCDYRQITDFATNYRSTLPYQSQISGLLFRPHVRNQKWITAVLNRKDFHRNLSEFDRYIANKTKTPSSASRDGAGGAGGAGADANIDRDVDADSELSDLPASLRGLVANSPVLRAGKPKIDAVSHPIVRFRMVATDKPDVYELWLEGYDKKYGIASIPTLSLSQKVRDWFGSDRIKELVVEAEYMKAFNKWRPVQPCPSASSADSIQSLTLK